MIKIHRIQAYLLRHLYETRVSLDRQANMVFFPAIDLLTFGFLTVYIDRLEVKAGLAGALLGGIIFWTLVYNIVHDISFSLLEDAWSRNLYNLISTPLKVSEIILGMLSLSIFKTVITTVLIVALAYGLFDFNLFQFGGIIPFYIFNIFFFGWAFGYATTSLIFRFGTKVQAFAWSLILVLYPISGVFYPLDTLPSFLASIAKFLPLSYVFEGLRSIIISQQIPASSDLVIITALNIIYLLIGIWLFVVGFRSAKRRGWFIHPS